MKKDIRISVAIATYNGGKYIKEQIDSIIENLEENDEIVISDDGSTDNTIEIINLYEDERIKIIQGPRDGVKKNFDNAIKACSGKYIFLSDQDDIWEKGKVEKVLKIFKSNEKCLCVVHDSCVFDTVTNEIIIESFYNYRKSGAGVIKNIIKNSYIGCCMAFDSSMKKYILPIPNDIDMHDQWIGILCETKGKSIFIKDKLIKYRRHSDNVSKMEHYPLKKMIINRINILVNLIKFLKRRI